MNVQFLNPDRTMLITWWPGGGDGVIGKVTIARRNHRDHVWGPPEARGTGTLETCREWAAAFGCYIKEVAE